MKGFIKVAVVTASVATVSAVAYKWLLKQNSRRYSSLKSRK